MTTSAADYTKGLWKATADSFANIIVDTEGNEIAIVKSSGDARRIVASVNFCSPIQTEQLECHSDPTVHMAKLTAENEALRKANTVLQNEFRRIQSCYFIAEEQIRLLGKELAERNRS